VQIESALEKLKNADHKVAKDLAEKVGFIAHYRTG